MAAIELLPDLSSPGSIVKYVASIGAQAVFCAAALFILARFIFTPLVKIYRFRRLQIDEVNVSTEALAEQNALLQEEYDRRMEGAEQLANDRKELTRLMERRRIEMILSDVKRETGRDLENIIKKTEATYAAVKPTLDAKASVLGRELAEKLIQR